jgi:hypothetical protein
MSDKKPKKPEEPIVGTSASLDVLVSVGFSTTQSESVKAALDGAGDVNQMVQDGLWVAAAEVVNNPAATAADLAAAGFSQSQVSVLR